MPKPSPSSASPQGSRSDGAPPDHGDDTYAAAQTALAHRVRALGALAVEGADRVSFLQGQVTQDVQTLLPGQARPAAGLTPKGKLLYWGRVWNDGERLLLLIPEAALAAVAAHLGKYAVFQKVSVRDATAEHAVLALYGPGAAAVIPASGTVALPPEGEFAAERLGPRPLIAEWAARLERGGSRLVPDRIAEILRVEGGRPRLGKDADDTHMPEEVGLSSAISATKGCYVGQEVVARLRTYGRVNRRLVGFRIPSPPLPEGTAFPDPRKPDHELARITSVVVSPRFGTIGLGLAFREIRDGDSLAIAGRPETIAVVSPLPFA